MTDKEWLASDEAKEKSMRFYARFDYRTNIGQQRVYLSDPKNIKLHGFYPFIHYKQKQTKYSKADGKTDKKRDICYAAHIDRCIYQYYNFILGELYNQRVEQDRIFHVAVAYRSDLHQSNINFAKRAIDFIRNNSPCYIYDWRFHWLFRQSGSQLFKASMVFFAGGITAPRRSLCCLQKFN
ncbi:hypothetical protein [Acutalibacter caecimuris]|uniref:hypothetical protein n=1 Tax=Acutalibacter caecimuris TaxID=3093657 RepID=UPI002AC9EBA0|nr:hypothetical protein [Acutalibacter sp. M00118]